MGKTSIIPIDGLNRKQLTRLALDLGLTTRELQNHGIPEPTNPKERTMQRLRLEDRFHNNHR